MVEQKLKKLQNISVNNSVKNEDWEKILEKDRGQSKFNWKEISTIVAVIALAFTLFFISNKPIENQAADPYAPIKAIYFKNMNSIVGDVETKSNYYPFVQKFEGETLNAIQEKIQNATWQQIEGTLEGSYVTYKFEFADGSSKILRNYINEPTEYLFEEDSGYAYVLQAHTFSDTLQMEMMKIHLAIVTEEYKQVLYLILFLTPLGILLFIRNHTYKKETGIQKLPKKYVNIRQRLAQVAILLLLLVPTVLLHNLHYGWWVIGLLGNVLIFRLLDDQSEHFKWRVINNLLYNLIALSIVTTQFYYFF
jgi:hypothetical protein